MFAPNHNIVRNPNDADLILVVDIYPNDDFESLRENWFLKHMPEKSFAIYEGDDPPSYLHGLFTSVPKNWTADSRFGSCGYYFHRKVYPNLPVADIQMNRDLLFSFAGRNSHEVRNRIFRSMFPSDVVIKNTSQYYHFSNDNNLPKNQFQKDYWNLAFRSKFALCPRGRGNSSIRLFEMMEYGIAPIIISDDWVPPIGPDWEEFAIFVPEKQLENLYKIVNQKGSEWQYRGQLAKKAFTDFFSEQAYFQFLISAILQIQSNQRYSEKYLTLLNPLKNMRNEIHSIKNKLAQKVKKTISILSSATR
jgi:hypothetical protein